MQVVEKGGSYEVEPVSSPPSEWVVESPALDYSCYIAVSNQTGQELQRAQPASAKHGYYVVEPPESIPPGTRAEFWMQDFPGPNGSTGSVGYASKNGGSSWTLKYSCPMPPGWSPFNSCEGAPFETRSGTNPWGGPNRIAKSGHPFFVNFTIR